MVVDGTDDDLNGEWDADDEAGVHEADEVHVEVNEDLYWDGMGWHGMGWDYVLF